MDIRSLLNIVEGAFDIESTYEYGTNKTAAEYANQVWFHGTDEDFDEFRLGIRRMGDGKALWFSENPKMSGYYGPNQYKVKLHFHNPLIISEEEYENRTKHAFVTDARAGNDALIIQDIDDGDTISTICCVFDPSIVEILGKDIYKDEYEDELEEARLPLQKGSVNSMRSSYAALLVVMDPNDFIRLTTPADEIEQIHKDRFALSISDYETGADTEFNKSKYNIPWLSVDHTTGKVKGHEGRHRAAMVAKEGGTKFPCVLLFRKPTAYEITYTIEPLEYDEDGMISYDYDNVTSVSRVFASKEEAEQFEKYLRSENDSDDQPQNYYSDIEITTIGGDTMKGSPRSEPENWKYDAWKKEDMPKQLIGQFDSLVVVPSSRMKVGVVKGYRHYK